MNWPILASKIPSYKDASYFAECVYVGVMFLLELHFDEGMAEANFESKGKLPVPENYQSLKNKQPLSEECSK